MQSIEGGFIHFIQVYFTFPQDTVNTVLPYWDRTIVNVNTFPTMTSQHVYCGKRPVARLAGNFSKDAPLNCPLTGIGLFSA